MRPLKIGLLIVICVEVCALGSVIFSRLHDATAADNRSSITRTTTTKKIVTTGFVAVDDRVKLLQDAGVIGESLGVSHHDVCYINHRDQGWVAFTHYQKCYSRYVQGFEATTSMESTAQKVAAQPRAKAVYGELASSYKGPAVFPCQVFTKDSDTSLLYLPAGPIPAEDVEYGCKIPEALQGLFSVDGAITSDNELISKTYKSFDPDKIDSSKRQIWIQYDEEYYTEELGCKQGGVICQSPRDQPTLKLHK